MFEFFVWLHISESVDEAGESDERCQDAIAKLRHFLSSELGWGALGSDRNQVGGVEVMNGLPVLTAFGASNHDREFSDGILRLLHLAGEVAPGSYGVGRYLDLEHNDGWVVHTLIRGQVQQRPDPWFSPTIPTVEDPPAIA